MGKTRIFLPQGGKMGGNHFFRKGSFAVVMIAIYALALIFAFLLAFGYVLRFEKREGSFILLFGLITFANLGYLLT